MKKVVYQQNIVCYISVPVVSLMLFACSVCIGAGGNKVWDKRFGGSNDDYLESLMQTADGGYILGGYSASVADGDKSQERQGGYDYWVVKINSSGTKEWDKSFGGGSDDDLQSLVQTADGGYILGGYSKSGADDGDKTQGSRGARDYWIVKIDSNGIKEWDKRFGGSGNDFLKSVSQTADGGYILGGYSDSGAGGDKSQDSRGGYDYWVVKIDSNGAKEWDSRFGGSDYDSLRSLEQTTDGGYILGGYSSSGVDGDKSQGSRGNSDYWVVKIDSNGAKEWDKRFGGSGYEYLRSLMQTSDGGYVLGGYTTSGADGDKSQDSWGLYDYWVVKIDSNGAKEWDKRFGGSDDDTLYSVSQTSDDGYILGGYSDSEATGDKSQASRGITDYWLVKIDSSGSKEWDKRFGGSQSEYLKSAAQTSNGGYILGGYSNSGADGDRSQDSRGYGDYWVVKLRAGAVQNDFDGDGKSDLGCYYAPGGNWYIFKSTNGFYQTAFGYVGTKPITGDFDGDGIGDFGCYYAPGGNWYIFKSSDGFYQTQFGYAGTIPITGDFDGDGKCDFGCYYPAGGNWYLFQSRDGFYQAQFGFAGTIPVSGDFDGDGKCDYGYYNPPTGEWKLSKSTVGFMETTFGYAGTIPITGDFDGDGKCDFGCYYAPGGNWYIFKSTDGFYQTAFGYAGTQPVVGDYDGDGKADIGCYYAPGGNWYIFGSSTGFYQDQFGYAGTIPLGTTQTTP